MRLQWVLLFTYILLVRFAFSQDLLTSRRSSAYTYVYKVLPSEGFKVEDLSNPIDSFPTGQFFQRRLPPGYYVLQSIEDEFVRYSYVYVPSFSAYCLNNSKDFLVKLVDSSGRPIDDALVRVKKRKLAFDPKLQAYYLKARKLPGKTLSITYKGETANYDIIGYRSGFRLSLKQRLIRMAWRQRRYFSRLHWCLASCRFQQLWTDFSQQIKKRFSRHFNYLIITNKPVYRRQDTLFFKALILTKKGRPVRFKTTLYIDQKRIKTISPSGKGIYTGWIVLNDSLISPDRRDYTLSLRHGRYRFSKKFQCYDYELNETKLSVRTDKQVQYRGQSLTLSIKATDYNGLNLPNAKAIISLNTQKVDKVFGDYLFIPEVLWQKQVSLNNVGETKVTVPSDVFPQANFEYSVIVAVFAKGKRISKTLYVRYFWKKQELIARIVRDSIEFRFLNNGKTVPITGKLYRITEQNEYLFSRTHFNPRLFHGQSVSLPHKVKADPNVVFYYFVSDSLEQVLRLDPPDLEINGFRDRDSIFISVNNPSKIPFHYSIFRLNKQIAYGQTDSLVFSEPNHKHKPYYVYVSFYWAGKEYSLSRKFDVINKHDIQLQVEAPKVVYPGQKVRITVKATDIKGRPVKNVDITAYSLKSAFRPPTPPVFYKYKVRKKRFEKVFHLKNSELPPEGRRLIDTTEYFRLYGLDTIEFYKFLNPQFVYRYQTRTKDSSTVFTVYVTENGHTLNTKYIELNGKPVYFYFVDNQPYMFDVEPGVRYTLKILTEKYLLILRDVTFPKGMKTIMSINVRAEQNERFQVFDVDETFAAEYQKFVRNHTISYVNSFSGPSFVRQGSRYFLLNESGFLGPLMPNQKAEFTAMPDYSRQFLVMPGYRYIFDQMPLRIKPWDFYEPTVKRREIDFYVYPWRRSDFDSLYLEYLYSQRKKLKFGVSAVKPTSDVHIELSLLQADAVNFVLFSPNSFSIFPPRKDLQVKFAPSEPYNLLILYKNGYYQLFKNLLGHDGGKTFYKLSDSTKKINPYSRKLDSLLLFTQNKDTAFYDSVRRLVWQMSDFSGIRLKPAQPGQYPSFKPKYIVWGQVRGVVKDKQDGSILPGCLVRIKGTDIGTITDVHGLFVLDDISGEVRLEFIAVGFKRKEITVMSGDSVEVDLEPEPLEMQNLLVTSKPHKRSTYTLRQAENAQINIQRTRKPRISAIHGYPLITLSQFEQLALSPQQVQKITFYPPKEAYEKFQVFADEGVSQVLLVSGDKFFVYGPVVLPTATADSTLMHSSLRSNFRDYAFWQPNLRTDRHGQATFLATFPDDVTQWTNFFVAYKPGKNSKVIRTTTRAYKPVVVQLDLPRFLLKHDKTSIYGNVITYQSDTTTFTTEFYVDHKLVLKRQHKTQFSCTDTLIYQDKGADDTVSFTYKMVKANGYFDGELRKLPILPIGAELAQGVFYKLDKDTIITISMDTTEALVNIYAAADELDLIFNEARAVARYRYYCNEQLASELLALLTMRKIAEFKRLKYNYDRRISLIIRKLQSRRNDQGLWGWWDENHTVDWISMHVLRALHQAEKQGFQTGLAINNQKIARNLLNQLDHTEDIDAKINIIEYLQLLRYEHFDPKEFAYSLLNDSTIKLSVWQKFRLYQILSSLGEKIPIRQIMAYKRETLFGNYYFEYPSRDDDIQKNTLTFTLLAYKILRNAHVGDDTLRRIRNYFFQNYGKTQWYNTYLKSSVFSTILPDLLKQSKTVQKTELIFSVGYNKTVRKFPFADTIRATAEIKVEKTGAYPVYLTLYKRLWVTNPKSDSVYFSISTEINGQADSVIMLKQDSLYNLVAKVRVQKPVEYVMISIPIPAGCVYTAKPQAESYRIYQKDRVLVFARRLKPGIHTFSVPLTARYKGIYTLNPAKIELMYFPTFYSSNAPKTVVIR